MFPTLLFSQLNNKHKSKARKVNQFFIRKELILDKGQGFWKRWKICPDIENEVNLICGIDLVVICGTN